MLQYIITALLLLGFFSGIAQSTTEEELVIFIQPDKDSDFTTKNLKELERFLDKYAIPVRYIDVSQQGAPRWVGFTPFLVYRNHLGKKVYKGRHTTHQRLLNFIRTVRHLPEAPINYEEEQLFSWQHPRAALLLKPKITPLTGAIPDQLDADWVKEQAINGLQKGWSSTSYEAKYTVTDADEMMYTNYYPYLAQDGTVYVSMELYAHYDCHTPIYRQYDNPAKGATLEEAFKQASEMMKEEITRQIKHSAEGDAMNFLTKNIKVTRWEALKLPELKQPERHGASLNVSVELPLNWEMDGSVEANAPILTFNFPAPLRHYGGTINHAEGRMQLQKADDLSGLKGNFQVETAAVQMGQTELNEYVQGSVLSVNAYPTATLTFQSVVGDQLQLQLGRITTAEVKATLQLLDKNSPVHAITQFEPFLTAEGELRLLVSTQFTAYDLTGNYSIEGPDGPPEANNQLLFHANFVMRPASENK